MVGRIAIREGGGRTKIDRSNEEFDEIENGAVLIRASC